MESFVKAVDQPNAMRCADGSLVFPDDTADALAFQHYHRATWVNGAPEWFKPYKRSDGEQAQRGPGPARPDAEPAEG